MNLVATQFAMQPVCNAAWAAHALHSDQLWGQCDQEACTEDCCQDEYDHPNNLAGQGTMGLDILDQVPDLDAIVVPVGGGGLITSS